MTRETGAKVKYGIWGGVLGAIIAMVVGFAWGGWVTNKTSVALSDAAVLETQSAICVAQFAVAEDHEEQAAAFAALSSWNQAEFVRKSGWDKMPGEEVSEYQVAGACGKGIEMLTKK